MNQYYRQFTNKKETTLQSYHFFRSILHLKWVFKIKFSFCKAIAKKCLYLSKSIRNSIQILIPGSRTSFRGIFFPKSEWSFLNNVFSQSEENKISNKEFGKIIVRICFMRRVRWSSSIKKLAIIDVKFLSWNSYGFISYHKLCD